LPENDGVLLLGDLCAAPEKKQCDELSGLKKILFRYYKCLKSFIFKRIYMKHNLVPKPANQDEVTLYCFMGEAICMIQHVEAALSHAITLKLNSEANKEAADEILNKHRGYTLGKAIKMSASEKIFVESLQNGLIDFLQERNWLVHKAMFESKDDLHVESAKIKLFQRIKSISNTAQVLQHEIELDMVIFCTSKGRDMSKILAVINEQYNESE